MAFEIKTVEEMLFCKKKSKRVSNDTLAKELGIDRKTLFTRVKCPDTFRGYELSKLYQFLDFTDEERIAFNREVTK